MLLIHKYHAVLIVAHKGRMFRAVIPEQWMAYWAKHCRSKGIMVRCI